MPDTPFNREYRPGFLAEVERRLHVNCPSPEEEMISLCKTMSKCPVAGANGALLRRITIDIDELISQIRWHLGQAILLMEVHPAIHTPDVNASDMFKIIGMPAAVQLSARAYSAGRDQLLRPALSANRKGGTVGGWIFHMMTDSAIYRAFSALDRLAVLVWHAAELSAKEHISFRSGKLRKVHDELASAESKALLEIAADDLFEYLTTYRNGFSHTTKAYSAIAGFPPADSWTTEEGGRIVVPPDGLSGDDLFTLANAAYGQVRLALPHVVIICKKSGLFLRTVRRLSSYKTSRDCIDSHLLGHVGQFLLPRRLRCRQ
jgi:hypothetical protein